MSLVNKMLRDLDARRAAPGERAALPAAVTPLAARQAPRQGKAVWLGALLVAAAAAAWWWFLPAAPPKLAVVASPAPPAAVAPTLAPAVAAVPPALTIAPADTTPAPPKPAPVEPELRIDPDLAVLPQERPAARGKPLPGAPPAPRAAAATPAVVAAVPTSPVKPAAAVTAKEAPATESSINKQPRLPTAAERAEADYRRGVQAQRQGLKDEAAARYQAALAEYAEHAAARQSLAALLIELRRYDEAEALLRKGIGIVLPAVRLASTLALARLKVERGQSAAALDLLLENAAAGERSADYQGFAAALLNRAGRQREAAERYQAATQLAPNDGRWWAGLGIVLDAEGKTAEARTAYQKASVLPGLPAELALHIEQRLRQP